MIRRGLKLLLWLLVLAPSFGWAANDSFLTEWRRWAQRPRAIAMKNAILAQIQNKTEGPMFLMAPIDFDGQFHRRADGNFVISLVDVRYDGLEYGNARHARLRFGFAELVAAMMSIREDLRAEYPNFRVVINSRIHNQWLGQTLHELGFRETCDAILSGNPNYKRLSWQIP